MYSSNSGLSLGALLVTAAFAPAALAQNRPVAPIDGGVAATAQRAIPPIGYSEFTLPNGLRVILHEDHSTPIVGVNVWYHVGSRNETRGKTGYAHLFEHMMFQGSKNYDDDYFKALQEVGGTLNGSTNTDRTNYWEVVPSNFLERAIFLEADRMGGLLETLTQAKLANQRDVVKNEKRQNYDNRPYGLAGARIAEILYPEDHPYHWLTIGSLDDLTAASMDDIKDFFRRFYTPNNASLAIAGDFNPAEARRLVEKYFGPVKRGPDIKPVSAPVPKLNGTLRQGMEDRVASPRLTMVWHTVPAFNRDEAPLDVLASALGQGKNSRLYRALVYDKQVAQDVSASNVSRELAGTFQIVATPRRGVSLDSLEAAIDREVAHIIASPPSREDIQRAYNVNEARRIYSLQTVGGFGGKSDQLNQNAVFTGNPGFFEQDLARYRAVTPADLQRVARTYLGDNKLIFTVTPLAGSRQMSQSAAAGAAASGAASGQVTDAEPAPTGADLNTSLPPGGPDPGFTLPRLQRRKLSNGLDVLIVEHHEMPVVTMNLVLKAGASADPASGAGTAVVAADMLDEGTTHRSALDLSTELASIGANLSSTSDWDANRLSLTTLTRHTDAALGIFADVLLNPAFNAQDLERIRSSRLQQLASRRNEATSIASDVYANILYGSAHPYGHPQNGTEATIRGMTGESLRAFYSTWYRPNNAALVVVGDVQPDAIVAQLEKALAGWKAAPVPSVRLDQAPAERKQSTVYLVDRPGAAQSVINIGLVGAARSTPDYFARVVLNQILGGAFVSRVNLNLRENKGYTYGARTSFDYRRGAGPFTASAGVQTAVTKESVTEFLKELRGIRGEVPVTPLELERAKQSLIRGFPRTFETPAQIASRLGDVVLYGLPDDYFNGYIAAIQKVTAADISRVANAAIDPSHLAILVVGDRAAIEPGLRSLQDVGTTVTLLNPDGTPVTSGGQRP
ncbi:MAG TPA: pitrilysin family protein [Gemmatimonadaceae bacterium]|nr:pitrilysin family protein [Gemmatimonadaceae bacterium]